MNKNKKLQIVVYRHGPKIGDAGSLSSEGEQVTRSFFENLFRNKNHNHFAIEIEHSPILRTKQTADIYCEIAHKHGWNIRSVKTDERLSEGTVSEHPELMELYGGRGGGKWVPGWLAIKERSLPEVMTGQEVVAHFSSWVLSKIQEFKESSADHNIVAFSHGLVMVSFLMKFDEILGKPMFMENWFERKVFSTELGYLGSIIINFDINTPREVSIKILTKEAVVPLKALFELSRIG